MALLLSSLALGCDEPEQPSEDAGEHFDSGREDAGPEDGGDEDAGLEDAGLEDAGSDAAIDGGVGADFDLFLEFERIPLEDDPPQITDLAFIAGTDDLLVTTRDGWIHRYRLEDDAGALVGSVQVPDVHVELDCGLISVAIDPDFAENSFVFVGQCFSGTHSGIQRIHLDVSEPAASAASAVEIARFGDDAAVRPWHNVGKLGFEPSGVLYTAFGDKFVSENASDPSNPLGALVRIIPSRTPGEGGHEPAPGNPHETDDAFHPDVYAYGLRSPWTVTLQPDLGWLVADVGNGRTEEISLIDAPGLDMGWPMFEGPCGEDCGDTTPPLLHWGRGNGIPYARDDIYAEPGPFRVAWVAPFYAPASPELDRYDGQLTGRTLFGGLCLGFVRALEVDATGQVTVDEPVGHIVGATGWETGPDGFLYAARLGRCTANASAVFEPAGLYRAVPGEPPPAFEPPEGLPEQFSEFGLFPLAPDLTVTPTEALEYSPRHPLWSNGLDKVRHVVLPDGSHASRLTPGDDMPEGTLFFKTFFAQGRAVETRVLLRTEDGWAPAVYLWNAENTEATRLDGAAATDVVVTVGGESVTHQIPSRTQCAGCHEVGARTILGFNPTQLHGDHWIRHEDANTEAVMGYVYANCSHCHDGSGGAGASFSMLADDFLANVIDQPTEGSASGAGIRVIPGDPDQSILLRALERTDPDVAPMPPLGVQSRDDEAVALMRTWITALQDD